MQVKMADDAENDDQWLYGEHPDNPAEEPAPEQLETSGIAPEPVQNDIDANAASISPEEHAPPPSEEPEEANESQENLDESNTTDKQNGEGSDKEDYEEDSDDDVNVVIGDIKTSPAYTSLNIKRGGLLTTTAKGDKTAQPATQSGKFTIEEFDQAGLINGIPVGDFNLDSLEDKPWRKPGADITDYFNYGFNEDTWRAYCERQKRMRVNESGTGLLPLNAIGMPRGPQPIMNDNSKYAGNYAGLRKAGPPPGRRMAGSIDVIGGATTRVGAAIGKIEPPKENVIQVMTADRREYSRKPGFPDMSVPPPTAGFPEFHPEFDFNPEPEPFYGGGYEPTQDSQWGTTNPSWQPQEIKTLTPSSPLPAPVPPVMGMPMRPMSAVSMPAPSPIKENSPRRRSMSREREKESSRRDRSRDRDREKSHRRERSRSRTRRPRKTRSRSPSHSHRSHRKKKSRRHEESE